MTKGNVVFEQSPELGKGKRKLQDRTLDSEKTIPNDDVARRDLSAFAQNYNFPIPDAIIAPKKYSSALVKIFQYSSGAFVSADSDYNDFQYLNFVEKYELNQYHNLLDQSLRNLFEVQGLPNSKELSALRSYDKTTMEQHIFSNLLLPTPKEIMRTTVRLVCGANPEDVSVLFFLHQCYRTSSCRNLIDGDNIRFREKLLGHCRKLISSKLQKSIADITLSSLPIKEIRSYSNDEVILETVLGNNNYVCNLLAMALRPEQLHKIKVEDQLLSEDDFTLATAMVPGHIRTFQIQYDENFWIKDGYSGEILSTRGPILWAMEKPSFKTSGYFHERSSILVGYLKVNQESETDSKTAVIEQLVKLFGEDAANPVNYSETQLSDVYIPRCGDFIALRRLTEKETRGNLNWGGLDVFGEGDVVAALEAGHSTFNKLVSTLRPQAGTFDDVTALAPTHKLGSFPFHYYYSHFNIVKVLHVVVGAVVIYQGISFARSMLRK